jgi:hypothetical protein
MGYFVRRNVPVSTYDRGEYATRRVDITDIDVLGSRWDEDLRPDRVACECKSGSSAKPLDRCFWLNGVMQYFGARKGYLLVKEAGQLPRRLGQTLNVSVLDEGMLLDFEKRYDISSESWIGYHSPGLDFKILEHKKTLGQIFRRQLNYLIYGYWKDPEYYQIKRLLAISREIATGFQSSEPFAWLSVETVCLLTVSLVAFCHNLYVTPPNRLSEDVSTQLFGGYVPKIEREGIAKSAIRILEPYVEPQVREKLSFGAKGLSLDPDYVEQLVDLISRLLNKPGEVRILPQLMDVVCYEFLYNKKQPSKEILESRFPGHDVFLTAKLAKNVVQFYLDVTRTKTSLYESFLSF